MGTKAALVVMVTLKRHTAQPHYLPQLFSNVASNEVTVQRKILLSFCSDACASEEADISWQSL